MTSNSLRCCSYHVTFMMLVNNPAAIILLGVAVAHADWGTAKELPCRVEEFDSQICKYLWCCIYNSVFVVSLVCSVGILLLCSVPFLSLCQQWHGQWFVGRPHLFLLSSSSSWRTHPLLWNKSTIKKVCNKITAEERRGEERREEKRRAEERRAEKRRGEGRGKGSRRTGSSVNGDVIIKWRNLRTRTGHV